MRDNIPAQFQDRFRKVSAKLRVADERPVFTQFPAQETGVSMAQFCQTVTHDVVAGEEVWELAQYGFVTGSNDVHLVMTALDETTSPLTRFYTEYGPFVTGTPLSEKHRAIAASGPALYGALNGKVYVQDTPGNWRQIADLIDPVTGIVPEISLAAVRSDYVIAAAVYAGGDVPDHCKISVINAAGYKDTWNGFLPKHITRPGLAALIEADGVFHIYVDDWSGKKPLYLRRFATTVWSATAEILPMDALDDESSFKVGYVTKLANGRVFLTGVLKRKYGPAYSVYLLGPDKFTFGRDMVIRAEYSQPLMIAASGTRIWALGKADVFTAPLVPGIFTDLSPTRESDVFRFNLEMPTNNADRLTLEVPVSEMERLPEDMVAGAMLDLDVTANDQSMTLGRFGIDRFRKMTREDGQSFSVDCSSYAMKKLMDWESDTYFDYIGQGESHGDPGDLTKLVRFSGGKYSTPTGGLQLDSLNDDGMLYTTVPASHGGFIRCIFTNVQMTGNLIGVGLNYGEESLAEAAARLKKKVEEIKAGERGRWALIAVYNPQRQYTGSPTIMLMDYNTLRRGTVDDPNKLAAWRPIKEVVVAPAASGADVMLAMQYQDGYARVYYSETGSPDLRLALSSEALLKWDLHPTEHENYGRGLIFMRNNTGFHMSYPVMSDSDVIPLYLLGDKELKFGQPIEDRSGNFPGMGGTVLIDSERITYSGIANTAHTSTELQWLPGKVVARAGDGVNTPAGTDTAFASSRGNGNQPNNIACTVHGNNYVLQSFTVPNGTVLTAVRVWLKKVNFPEDGVTLTINRGNVASSASAVALVNNQIASASPLNANDLKTEGGWVTFYLGSEHIVQNVSGQQYWVMIRRNKNANHPSSTSYFQYKKMADTTYGGNGCYVFCEEDDQAIWQGGDMAFVVYAKPDGANKEYMFPVQWQDNVGLPTDGSTTYFNGHALTITAGMGKNNCYRIVRCFRLQDSLNNLFIFCLDRNAGKIFGSDTKARAVPALYGLKRGQSGTLAAAHGDKSMVHLPATQTPKAAYFEYFTADEDMTLAETVEQIARKAGVIAVDLCNRHPGQIASGTAAVTLPAISKNLIITMKVPTMAGGADYVHTSFLDSSGSVVMAVHFAVNTFSGASGWLILSYMGAAYLENVLALPFDERFSGDLRISLYDGHISVWCGGRLLGAANFGEHLKAFASYQVVTNMETPVKVMIPQAGTRVDSFVMDMGKTGASLLTSLIGEKRVFFRDDGAGGLKTYTDRETVPQTYTRAVGVSTETTDIGLATRVLLEGGEVVEVSSAGNLQKYGNFFKTFNFHEINNLDDAQYFADMVLEDMSLNRERIEVEGAADPAVEPTDIITIQLPDGQIRLAVVDGFSHFMYVDEGEAVYDMRLSGRFKTEEA